MENNENSMVDRIHSHNYFLSYRYYVYNAVLATWQQRSCLKELDLSVAVKHEYVEIKTIQRVIPNSNIKWLNIAQIHI